MNADVARYVVDHLTYKPNVKIEWLGEPLDPEMAAHMGAGSVHIVITMYAEDVEHKRDVNLVFRQLWLARAELERHTLKSFVRRIRLEIQDLEVHELDEYLKYQGQLVTEPHPDLFTGRVHPELAR